MSSSNISGRLNLIILYASLFRFFMKSSRFNWNKIERTIGGLKFAVVIVLLFTTFMIVGTFIESYYGTDFVNRIIYKKWYFMAVQFFMLLSIIFAAFLRLPPKKRLYGFYTIHAGLVIVGMGSLITYIAGIDGSITLSPNSPNRHVVLSRDVLKIIYPEDQRQITKFLPYNAYETVLDETYGDFQFVDYYPFAEPKFTWTEAKGEYPAEAFYHSSTYLFKNAFAEQEFTVSLHPEATEFDSTFSMGPLSVSYLPFGMTPCFAKSNPSKLILWNGVNHTCTTPEDAKITLKTTSEGNRFLVIEEHGQFLSFFPDLSPFPLDQNMQVNKKSDSRVFSKKLFEGKPHLFLFGKAAAYFDKSSSSWQVKSLDENGAPEILPWMSAEIKLLKHSDQLVPTNYPEPVVPIQKDGQIIKGNIRALSMIADGKKYWITNNNPLSLNVNGKKVNFYVTKETLTLPFELVLSEFKMDKDPGTNNPASYESFVKLFTNDGSTSHHVFMNNPLKYNGFTFYQASYGQDDNGNYQSTLSVNVDQGRFLKYLGSLMLVFGATWHYYLNQKKSKRESDGVST